MTLKRIGLLICGATMCAAAAADTVLAAIGVDQTVWKEQGAASTTVAAGPFSTASSNELLLAFVSTDGPTSGTNTTVTGIGTTGLTWVLVKRTNTQAGTSEIWRAFATSPLSNVTVTATLSGSVSSLLTVMSFTGVDSSGTNGVNAVGATGTGNLGSGAPTASLTTTRNNSLVVGVGNDWDRAVSRTPGSNQSIVHQYLAPVGDTYWVQRQNSTTPSSGTVVAIDDSAPATDRFNLTICEILAASTTFNISGTVTPVPAGSGVSVAVTGPSGTTTTTTSGAGAYSVGGLANATYTVTPSKANAAFTPSNRLITISGANVSGVDFTLQTHLISGTVSGGSGATVALSGAATASIVADASGNYVFSGLLDGNYTITPAKTGFTFSPASQNITLAGADVPGVNFGTLYSISGTVTGGGGATVSLEGTASTAVTVDSSGHYSFPNLGNGTYTITPSKTGFSFNPPNQSIVINGAGATGIDFTVVTYTISGKITGPIAAAVNLGGSATATVTADASGNYAFNGLNAGNYIVTPSKAGFTFSPSSQNVPLTSASVTDVNFSAPTYTISGTVTGTGGSTVALTGTSTGTVTSDSFGNYTFDHLGSGDYTVTPSKSGFSFTPLNRSVTITAANMSSVDFTAQVQATALALDVTVWKDQDPISTTVITPAFSTAAGNELLLAMIASDGSSSGTNVVVNNVTGAGLAWVLVKRTNVQRGTAEIWRAFAPAVLSNVTVTAALSQNVSSSMTLMSFTGADSIIGATGTGNAMTGAPTASLVTTRANSWVIGVGNDWDKPLARTPGTGQIVVHQYFPSAGDTFWVQRLNAPTPNSGTTVTLNDTAPTTDRYNLSIAEVMPSSGGGSGGGTPPTITMTSPAPNTTIANKTTVAANATGNGAAINSVQFLLDGANLGSATSAPPYSVIWDTATANAGNHALTAIAYDSKGLSTTSAPVTVTVDNTNNPGVVGSWSSVVNLPAVAVNLILMKNDKLFFYQDGSTPTVWDYKNNSFLTFPTANDLFCSGHAVLADGRILVIGGFGGTSSRYGIKNAAIFDPSSNSWTGVPSMTYSRWYPTATTLSDGRVIVTGGWQTKAHTNAGIPEIYDPATNAWTRLTNANNPFETYPFIYQLGDGRILHVGGSEYATTTDVLNLSTQTWTTLDPQVADGSSSVMYAPGKIMKAGSASDSQFVGPSSNTAFVLDVNQPSPSWRQTLPMVYPRSFMNLTMLPDGSVLATGGETDKNGGNVSNAVYAAEIWSPQTQTWRTMSSMQTPREYHGTALLLPDGRVVVSGMGADFGQVPDQRSAEFYSPPYLFKGARPRITQAPAQIAYNQGFFVATPDASTITSAVLIRTGAVTHFFDQNTHYVPVSFQQSSGGLTVQAPTNAYAAPPGFYMLFLMNSNGVPSIAPFVQLQ